MDLQSDQVCKFLDACERAGIKNPAAFLASKRHMVYDWLLGAFPHGIKPTDIDGLIHLNGYFLLLEFKDAGVLKNAIVPKGQLICLNALPDSGRFTVFLIGMDRNNEPTCMEEIHPNKKRVPLKEVDREVIRARCAEWARWAESDKPFKPAQTDGTPAIQHFQ